MAKEEKELRIAKKNCFIYCFDISDKGVDGGLLLQIINLKKNKKE